MTEKQLQERLAQLEAENAALKAGQGEVKAALRSYISKKGTRAGKQGFSLELTGGIFGSGFGYGQTPQWWARVVPHIDKIRAALTTEAVKEAIALQQRAA